MKTERAGQGHNPYMLYRHYAQDPWTDQKHLLYVGITNDPARRFSQHADKPWWRDVAETTYEFHRTKASALAGEATAIMKEHPAYNRTHGNDPLNSSYFAWCLDDDYPRLTVEWAMDDSRQ